MRRIWMYGQGGGCAERLCALQRRGEEVCTLGLCDGSFAGWYPVCGNEPGED